MVEMIVLGHCRGRVAAGLALAATVTSVTTTACKPSEPEPAAKTPAKAEAKTEAEPAPEPQPDPEPPAPSAEAAAFADAVDPARYEAELRFIAAVRPPGSAHWQAVQDRCAEVLGASGFTTTRLAVEGAGVSVIGHKPGTQPDLPELVIGAHYDHIEDCPGADDNASGTAAVLELAQVLGPETWSRGLTIACWDEEESGLHGSRAFVDAAVAEGRRFELYINFDAIAYADDTPGSQTLPPGVDVMFAKEVAALEAREYRADFIAIMGDDGAHAAISRLRAHATRVELPSMVAEVPGALKNSDLLADLRRSDHANFWAHEIPAVFLSDTADFRTDTYHCGTRPDTVETLDLAFANKVVRTTAGAAAELLSEPGANPGDGKSGP